MTISLTQHLSLEYKLHVGIPLHRWTPVGFYTHDMSSHGVGRKHKQRVASGTCFFFSSNHKDMLYCTHKATRAPERKKNNWGAVWGLTVYLKWLPRQHMITCCRGSGGPAATVCYGFLCSEETLWKIPHMQLLAVCPTPYRVILKKKQKTAVQIQQLAWDMVRCFGVFFNSSPKIKMFKI